MQYGKQVVPISEEEEQSLQYLPDKAFELIGFVSEEQTPARHFFMKVTLLMLQFPVQCLPHERDVPLRGLKHCPKVYRPWAPKPACLAFL